MNPNRASGLRRLRGGLVLVGVLIWVPYVALKYGMGIPFPMGYVLAIHIPCMLGALGLRFWERHQRKTRGGES